MFSFCVVKTYIKCLSLHIFSTLLHPVVTRRQSETPLESHPPPDPCQRDQIEGEIRISLCQRDQVEEIMISCLQFLSKFPNKTYELCQKKRSCYVAQICLPKVEITTRPEVNFSQSIKSLLCLLRLRREIWMIDRIFSLMIKQQWFLFR